MNTQKREPIISPSFMKLWNRSHQHLSRLTELFLLLTYSSLNFAADWMIRASMPFVCWGQILWPNKLKLLSRKEIASIYCCHIFKMASFIFIKCKHLYYYVLLHSRWICYGVYFSYWICYKVTFFLLNIWHRVTFANGRRLSVTN